MRAAKLVVTVGILFPLLISGPLLAQVTGSALSGTITDQSGAVVPSAKIQIKSVATGQSMETQADSAGVYNVTKLTPGDYEISVSAEGFPSQITANSPMHFRHAAAGKCSRYRLC